MKGSNANRPGGIGLGARSYLAAQGAAAALAGGQHVDVVLHRFEGLRHLVERGFADAAEADQLREVDAVLVLEVAALVAKKRAACPGER